MKNKLNSIFFVFNYVKDVLSDLVIIRHWQKVHNEYQFSDWKKRSHIITLKSVHCITSYSFVVITKWHEKIQKLYENMSIYIFLSS